MCGIAGFISFQGQNPDQARERVEKMTDILAHRGPDESGIYVDEHAALGHRRLSIIDLSSGQQPMASEDSRLIVVFNGEIYNFLELQKKLQGLGYSFATCSDTEVILKAYAQWGRDCLQHLHGMFAFALWDREHQQVLLARDRVGKKPLYYTWDGHTLAFASELKSLLAGGWSKKDLEPRALDCFLTFGYVPSALSIFQDVAKLEPAHGLSAGGNGIEVFRYWSVSFAETQDLSLVDARDRFQELLDQAVSSRLMSEVPLGAFLSGGLDSNLVVASMARTLDRAVLTNTIGFGSRGEDESEVAREAANHLDANHFEFTVQPQAAQVLEDIAWHFDEPFADSSALPTWYVCQMARQNVTVALSGDGGDESFGGYTFRYQPHMLESRIRQALPTWLRSLVFGILGELYPGSSRLPRYLRLKTYLQNLAVGDAQAFYQDLAWLSGQDRELLYAASFRKALAGFTPLEPVLAKYAASDAQDALGRAQHTDLGFYMTEDVLVKVDRMSMAHALEVRSPFMDHRLIEFAASLPARLKLQGSQGKILLREAARQRLPRSVVDQPKQGFSIPAAQWLRGELKDMAQGSIFESRVISDFLNRSQVERMWREHQSGKRDHNVFLWGLMMLGLWEYHYL